MRFAVFCSLMMTFALPASAALQDGQCAVGPASVESQNSLPLSVTSAKARPFS